MNWLSAFLNIFRESTLDIPKDLWLATELFKRIYNFLDHYNKKRKGFGKRQKKLIVPDILPSFVDMYNYNNDFDIEGINNSLLVKDYYKEYISMILFLNKLIDNDHEDNYYIEFSYREKKLELYFNSDISYLHSFIINYLKTSLDFKKSLDSTKKADYLKYSRDLYSLIIIFKTYINFFNYEERKAFIKSILNSYIPYYDNSYFNEQQNILPEIVNILNTIIYGFFFKTSDFASVQYINDKIEFHDFNGNYYGLYNLDGHV
jgi:hypothetical protein